MHDHAPHHHDHHHHHEGAHGPGDTERPTANPSQTVLVDAANVAYTNRNESNDKGSLENILDMRKALVDLGYHPIFIADASLKYGVDHPEQLNDLEQSNQILQAPAGTQADYFLLAYARRENLPIVSNDAYRDRQDEFPEAFRRRVPFMIVDGQVIIDRERLPAPAQRRQA
ncbi:MAG TPA: hypothetical protein VNL16_03205 [Chloroflexota bacterium]|nr:hypothetical protein [Chloroflexota bacterium]